MLGCSSKLCNRLRSFVKQDIVVLESRAPVEILHENVIISGFSVFCIRFPRGQCDQHTMQVDQSALVHRISFVGLSLFLIALAIIVVDRAN